MELISPTRTDIQNPDEVKKYAPSLRLWHWLSAVVISGLLITVLLNSTLTSSHNTAAVVQDELQKSGIKLNADQSKSVGHALSDKTWEVHTYFGYALAGLFLFRIILEFFQLADQKFIGKWKTAYRQFNQTKQNREVALHEFTVRSIYAVFYLLLLIMVTTGLFLAFEDQLVAYKAIRHTVKEVHGFCMYLVLAFIVVHLAGVFLAERKDGKGIVSDMINGGRQQS